MKMMLGKCKPKERTHDLYIRQGKTYAKNTK